MLLKFSAVQELIFSSIKNIFEEPSDYEKLKEIIRRVKEEMRFELYAYCLMTNHVHLFIKEQNVGEISKITTSIIAKDTKHADYTEYYKAVESANKINRDLYSNIFELDQALAVDVSNRYSCEQSFVDEQTKAINEAIANLKLKKVETVELYASDTVLTLFDETKIITVINPKDVEYKSIEYISTNEKVIVVFPDGYVWCVGSGTADVTVRITNLDGSVAEGSISFESHLSNIEKSIAGLIRIFFIIASRISNIYK